jgi:hypothetical protein
MRSKTFDIIVFHPDPEVCGHTAWIINTKRGRRGVRVLRAHPAHLARRDHVAGALR